MYWNEIDLQIVHYDVLKFKNPLSPPKKPLSPDIHIQILHTDLYTFP